MKKTNKDFFQSTFSKELGLEKQITLDKYIIIDKFIEKVKPDIERMLSKYLTTNGIGEVIRAIRETISKNLR